MGYFKDGSNLNHLESSATCFFHLLCATCCSYSEVQLGQGADSKTKQYPMKWLLDHTLQQVAQSKWKKHVADDSRWFRLDPSLKYPIDLENMRYQIHLYQRVG